MDKILVKKEPKWGSEVFPLLSWFETEKVENAKVMVVGAGALGNEVLKGLALFGIGNIVIVDFDTIEYSNLCRSVLFRTSDAAENKAKASVAGQRVKEINPNVKVLTIKGDIQNDVGLGVFRRVDIVIGCLDSRFTRYIVNQHSFRADKVWIDGGIENLNGYVRVFKRDVSCYECGLTDTELEMLKLKTGCPDVAKLNYKYGRIATTPVSSSVIGAVQVQEAIKLIHGMEKESPQTTVNSQQNKSKPANLIGKMFSYDGLYLTSKVYSMVTHNPECVSHDKWEPVETIIELGADTTVKDALQIIKEHTKSDGIVINMMNNKFIVNIRPDNSEKKYEVLIPENKLNEFLQNNDLNIDLSKTIFQDFIENIDDSFPYKEMTLREIGFPYLDVIQVSCTDTRHGVSTLRYFEFGKDLNYFKFK